MIDQRNTRCRRALVLAPGFIFFTLAGAVSASRESPAEVAQEAAALAIPRPDLSAMEATARGKIESMQSALEEFLKRDDIRPSELAEGFGHLGQLFHAYQLLDSAGECYAASHRLVDQDYRWPYYLGLARFAKGDLEASLNDFERALERKPDDPAALVRLGNALLELDRMDEAKARFERLLTLDSGSAMARYGLGRAAGLAGDDQEALRLFEEALTLQPDASVIHYPLGQAYRKVGDLEKAREHLQQRGEDAVVYPDPLGDQISRLAKGTAIEIVLALAKSADEYSEEEFLGFALSHFGDVRGSIEQLQQGLALQQEMEASAVERGRIHYVLGGLMVNDDRDDEALEQFQRAAELAPELVDARVKLGNALARLGRLEEALATYDEVLAKGSQDGAVRLKRVSALMQLERGDEARGELEQLVELLPESSEVQVRLATLFEQSADVEAAIAHYRAASELELTPFERPQVHFRLASLLRQRSVFEEALGHYEKALEAEPGLVPALSGRGSLLAQLGRFREAAPVYAAWVEAEPNSLGPRVAEVSALILSEQHAAAKARLEAGLERFPDELQLKDILARHLAACPDRAVRDGARAVELARLVFKEVPTFESAETLAMALAQAGRFEEAVGLQKELMASLEAEEDAAGAAAAAGRMRGNLALYEKGEACCVE